MNPTIKTAARFGVFFTDGYCHEKGMAE